MGPSVKRVLPIRSNGSAPSNKMAAMPVYGKTLKIFFSRTKKGLGLNLGINYRGLKVYQVCSNDDRKLTFDLFTARLNLRP